MARAGRRATLITLVVALALATLTARADAGGSWMYPVRDRYEPGETATLVGYFGGGSYGPMVDEPYFAHIRLTTEDAVAFGEAIPVGELEFSKVEYQWRASITFDLPADLAPGQYMLDYCTAGCERRVGDLIGGYLSVGVDPDYSPSRSWPADEPEIENLADDVVLVINGLETTALDVRSGLWVPQATPQPHNDYPPATPTPPASAERASAQAPVEAATPTPTAVASVGESGEGPLVVRGTTRAELAGTGLASAAPSTSVVLGALVVASATAAAGRRLLRRRPDRFDG